MSANLLTFVSVASSGPLLIITTSAGASSGSPGASARPAARLSRPVSGWL